MPHPLGSWAQAVAHLYPQPQGSVLVSYSCTIAWCLHSYNFPAQVKLKANRLDSNPISLSFKQHKTLAYLLGFKIHICPSALRWLCHHSSVLVGLSQTPVGFAALQTPISKPGTRFLLRRQLAFPLVVSTVKR